jgi:hypothetical protein
MMPKTKRARQKKADTYGLFQERGEGHASSVKAGTGKRCTMEE